MDHKRKVTALQAIRDVAKKRLIDALVITDHMSTPALKQSSADLFGRRRRLNYFSELKQVLAMVTWGCGISSPAGGARSHRSFRKLADDMAKRQPQALRVLNHPGWWRIGARHYKPANFEFLKAKPRLDAIEIMNGSSLLRFTNYRLLKRWEMLLEKGLRPGLVGGSDAHKPDDVGSMFTVVAASHLTAEAVVRSVRRGQTYVSDGAKLTFEVSGQGPGSLLQVRPDTRRLLVDVAVDSSKPGTMRLFHHQHMVKAIPMQPGCESMRLVIDRETLTRDGYFRVDFIRRELKPAVFSKKLQKTLPAKVVDYSALPRALFITT